MMTTLRTIIDRIKNQPNDGTFPRKFWLILAVFFALAFLYELVRWSRGRGEPNQIAFTAGFLSMSAFWFSRSGRMRLVFFICGMALLIIYFAMRVLT
jgi:hypothetical protein